MNKLINENRKAIAAALTPLVALILAKAGLHLPDGAAAGVAAALTGAAVWFVRNRTYGTG
jgi:CBS-domain-containing membrane protein